jgi:predicted phage terminase large subunit-like protein
LGTSDLEVLLKDPAIREQYTRLDPQAAAAWAWRMMWLTRALKHQILPHGDWWSIWLMLAGRGAGKTRTAAEQIGWWAQSYKATRWLVAAPTSSDVRSTCFEGDSGLLSVIPAVLIADYNKALHEIKLTNGSLIKGIPASEPERFRGPQFHGGWCCTPGTLIAMADGTEKPIETLRAGEIVGTRHGSRKVLASGMSGNPSGLVTITSGSTRLTVTEDHPILIGDQWVPAGNIKEGDLLWTASFTPVSVGTRGQVATITTKGVGTFIDSSGKRSTAKSRMVLLSTTLITTLTTTTSRILRPCQSLITKGIMQLEGLALSVKKRLQERTYRGPGVLNRQLAYSALNNSFQPQPISLESSAQQNVWNHGGSMPSSQKPVSASSAQVSTWPRNRSSDTAASDAMQSPRCVPIELRQMVVSSVERLPNSLTYNLTVEGEHEFIANGVVVHNCDELAAWEYIQEAWDQIQFGMRLKLPDMKTRLICTTTPKPKDLIIDLISREGDDVVLTTASTYSNLDNLSDNFKRQILQYEGTKLGRQEIYAEIIDPEEGGIVQRDWFKLWPAGKELPKLEFVVQSYDCAFTEKTVNDPTASITFGVFKPQDGGMCALIIDAWQDRLQYPDLKPRVLDEYEIIFGEGKEAKKVDLVLVEDKAAGIVLIQDLQRAHIPVRAYNPGKADKIQRLSIVANIVKAGRVYVPESSNRSGYVRDWAEAMVTQICSFPNTDHDDFCDAFSQALRYLRDAGWLSIDPPAPDDYDPEDLIDAGVVKENPYAS